MIVQNSSDVTDKTRDDKVSVGSDVSNEAMNYRRIYEQHMKAAEDAKIQTSKLQQVILFQ